MKKITSLLVLSGLLSGCYITPVPPTHPPRANCREVVITEKVCVRSVDRHCVSWKNHKRRRWDC